LTDGFYMPSAADYSLGDKIWSTGTSHIAEHYMTSFHGIWIRIYVRCGWMSLSMSKNFIFPEISIRFPVEYWLLVE
jgi:hypothetical protein